MGDQITHDELLEHLQKMEHATNKRFAQGKRRMDVISAQVTRVENNTEVLIEVAQAFEGFVKVIGWVSAAARKLAPIIVLLGAIAAFFHGKWDHVHNIISHWFSS